MNRRNLLRKLGIGTGAVAAGTVAGLAVSVAKADVIEPEFDFKAYMKYAIKFEGEKYKDIPAGGLPIVFIDGPLRDGQKWNCRCHTGDTIHIPMHIPADNPETTSGQYLMTLAASRKFYYGEYQT